ncbi:hypothetical protein [Saccharicrinis fermentans]|uniref:PKD-like family protein n=1 Tax=Saccharicrinis fermentans DSM 9555 = JCM 21142 TaxID=869213 RepID=W7YGJ1_9BACT|nr:hypothetical protein [Saccharicrinis fermentans]GAF03541.1 hypothetical protein JCM21142_52219 [Saccharicrinis fermentans DSM 9555 = JCM 21142]
MRNNNIYLIIVLLAFVVVSCNEDLSEYAKVRYPDLIIYEEPSESSVFNEQFNYEPQFLTVQGEDTVLLEESAYDDYMYEWRILLQAGRYDTVTSVIGTERLLSTVLDMVLPASNPYTIVLRVTHKEVGFTQTFDWEVNVLSALGRGMLIAHTEDGGVSSDINLLMTKAYNDSFEETDQDIIHRNIISEVNGQKLDGLVSKLSFCNSTNHKTFYAVVEGETLFGMNNTTLAMEDSKNTDYFYYAPAVFNPQKIFNYYAAYGYIINNGVVHVQSASAGAKFEYIDEATYKYEIYNGYMSRWNSLYYFGGPLVCHDVMNNQFVFVGTTGTVKECTAPLETDDWAFNPRELPEDLVFVAGGLRDSYNVLMLMKSSSTNAFSIYRLATNTSREISGDYIFDLSNCPDLDRATAFAFSESYDEFYYAVDNELRVVILNVDAPTAKVSYSLPVGESITHIKIHLKVPGITTWSEYENDEGQMVPKWNSSIGNVITVASYNGTEGFIRTLPIQYGGAGGIAEDKYVHTYGGFGKITAIELRY